MVENPATIHVLGSRQADLHAVGPSGFSPLHILAQSETSLACVDALLKLGASVVVYDEVLATGALVVMSVALGLVVSLCVLVCVRVCV